jgi:hypothetical protein
MLLLTSSVVSDGRNPQALEQAVGAADWWEGGNCTGITSGHETWQCHAETALFLALVYYSKQKCWGKSLAVSFEICYSPPFWKLYI